MAAMISLKAALDVCAHLIPDTNPEHFDMTKQEGLQQWMLRNGQVCGITLVEIELKNLPTVDIAIERLGGGTP